MEEVPEHLKRYPTRSGREALAARLGLTFDPYSQDWEWEIAEAAHFQRWLAAYWDASMSDDERFSLMETLVQCVEGMCWDCETWQQVEQLPAWQAIAALLRERPELHANTIVYWSRFGADDLDEQFWVSVPMRRVWAEVRQAIAEQGAAADRPRE